MCVCVCCVSRSGCGTVVLVESQSAVHSSNYPQFYSHDCVLRWVVYAPQGHVVKVRHKFFRRIQVHDWNSWKLGLAFALRFSSTLLILTWRSRTPACMIPSLSWEMWKEPKRSVGKESFHSKLLCLSPFSPCVGCTLLWLKTHRTSPTTRGFFCCALCSGAVWWQPPSSCPVVPQRHGASVRVRRHHRT